MTDFTLLPERVVPSRRELRTYQDRSGAADADIVVEHDVGIYTLKVLCGSQVCCPGCFEALSDVADVRLGFGGRREAGPLLLLHLCVSCGRTMYPTPSAQA